MEGNFHLITYKQATVVFALGIAVGMVIIASVWALWPKKHYTFHPQQLDGNYIYI